MLTTWEQPFLCLRKLLGADEADLVPDIVRVLKYVSVVVEDEVFRRTALVLVQQVSELAHVVPVIDCNLWIVLNVREELVIEAEVGLI